MAVDMTAYWASRRPKQTSSVGGDVISQKLGNVAQEVGQVSPAPQGYTTPDYATMSTEDQLRRKQAWDAVQQGLATP